MMGDTLKRRGLSRHADRFAAVAALLIGAAFAVEGGRYIARCTILGVRRTDRTIIGDRCADARDNRG